jgi:hypothetical protein
MGVMGGGMQLGGSRRRAKRQKQVRGWQRAEAQRFGKENTEISDNLRIAMEGVAKKHGMNLTEYLEDRNGPLRTQAAEAAEARQVGAGQSGMDRALAVLQGPDTMRAPVSAPLAQSQATNQQILEPGLAAALEQIKNQGYLGGAAQFDTENQQELDLQNAPLSNEVFLRQLLGGVRQAENVDFNQRMNYFLGKRMEQANEAGGKQMLAGSLFQLGGKGLMSAGGAGAAQPSTTGQMGEIAPPSNTPQSLGHNPTQPDSLYYGPGQYGGDAYSR